MSDQSNGTFEQEPTPQERELAQLILRRLQDSRRAGDEISLENDASLAAQVAIAKATGSQS